MARRLLGIAFVSVFGVGLMGCTGGSGRSDLVQAKGKVLYKGQPVAGATVMFTPTEKGSPANGITDASGAFTMSTLGRPGVTVGKHRVTVTKVDASVTQDASKNQFEFTLAD
jgi:hypothetical protein